MELDFSQQIFKKILDNEFYENSSSGNQVVPCGRKDRQTDLMKLIVGFGNFTNATKKIILSPSFIKRKCKKLNVK